MKDKTYLVIIEWHCEGLNGARKPKEPSPNARVGGIGVESSKYCAAFRTVPVSTDKHTHTHTK